SAPPRSETPLPGESRTPNRAKEPGGIRGSRRRGEKTNRPEELRPALAGDRRREPARAGELPGVAADDLRHAEQRPGTCSRAEDNKRTEQDRLPGRRRRQEFTCRLHPRRRWRQEENGPRAEKAR